MDPVHRLERMKVIYPDLVVLNVLDNLSTNEMISEELYYDNATKYMSKIQDSIGMLQMGPDQLEKELKELNLNVPYAIHRLKNGLPDHIRRKFQTNQTAYLLDASEKAKDLYDAFVGKTVTPRQTLGLFKELRALVDKIVFKSQQNYSKTLQAWENRISQCSEHEEFSEEENEKILNDLDILRSGLRSDV